MIIFNFRSISTPMAIPVYSKCSCMGEAWARARRRREGYLFGSHLALSFSSCAEP